MKNKKAIIIVNAITMSRVVGTFVLPFIFRYMAPITVVIYIMCLLLTDAVDGFLARKLNACTIFGSLSDQAADKLLGIATLAVLASGYPIMIFPILTEISIAIITTRGAVHGGAAESSILGKIKTLILGLIIVGGFCTVYASEIVRIFTKLKVSPVLIDVFLKLEANGNDTMNSLAFIAVGAGVMVACDYWIKAKADIKTAKDSGLKPEEIKLKKGKELNYALFSEEYYQKTKKDPLIKKLGVPSKP